MKMVLTVLLLYSIYFSATSGELQHLNSIKDLQAPLGKIAQTRKKNNAIEDRAIFMVKRLFDNIIDRKDINGQDEEFYFGNNGGILGESIRLSLRDYGLNKTTHIDETKASPLAMLLSYKLYEVLKDKKRFSFAFSSEVHTIDRENIPRTGIFASHMLFVRAIPLTEDKYFNDIGNGVNFVFAINYTSNKKDSIYIELMYSYINGIPFYKFLGFYGNFASGLKLSDEEIERFFYGGY